MGRKSLEEMLSTQLDADERQPLTESQRSTQSVDLTIPESWKNDSLAKAAEDAPQQPAPKRRRSSAAGDDSQANSASLMKSLQEEVSQRSWDVPGASKSMEDSLVAIVHEEILKKGKKRTHAQEDEAGEGTLDEEHGEMAADIAARNVGTKSKLGRAFDYTRSKKTPEGQELKAAYAKLNGDRKAQTDYKVMWWKQKLKESKAKTELQEIDSVKEALNGVYKPLGKIIVDQGNDAPAVMKGFNIAKSCIKLWRKGHKFKGKEYLKVNGFSKGVEFMDITEVVTDEKMRKKIESILSGQDDDDDENLEDVDEAAAVPPERAQAAAVPARQANRTNAEAEAPTPPREEAPRPAPKRGTHPKKAVPTSKPKKTEVSTDIKKMIQKLVQMSQRSNTICAVCNQIAASIAKGGSWAPLEHPDLLGKLRTLREEIEAVKSKNKFWKTWAMGGADLAAQLKAFDAKTLWQQQAQADELDDKLTLLDKKNESMKKMHAVNPSSDED